MADPASPGGAPPTGAALAQQLVVNAQYLKDFSFESPRAPQSLLGQRAAPEVNLNVDVKARNLAPDTFEVVLTLGAQAHVDNEPIFVVELAYGALVTLRNASAELVPLLVFIETPRLIFPFARNIIAAATRDGGFPPLLVNPIDFAELLRRERAGAAKETAPPAGGNGGAPPGPSA